MRIKMKNKIKHFATSIIFIFVILLISSQAIAEYCFNDPDIPDESRQVAILVLDTLSLALTVMKELESNNLLEANKIKRTIEKNLQEVNKQLIEIKKGKTYQKKITEALLQKQQLKEYFSQYKIGKLSTKEDLINIAINQIENLSQHLRNNFRNDPTQNREIIRLIINEIHSIVILGVNISEINSILHLSRHPLPQSPYLYQNTH